MKSCRSNSRCGRLTPGGLMAKWSFLRGCALILCATLYLTMAPTGFAGSAPSAIPETSALRSLPEQTSSSTSSPAETKTAEQTTTEQYTLSHERQAKAVAYSRAGYTLYFISYLFGGLLLFLILGLGRKVSRYRRKCQRQKMDSRIHFRPAALPDDRRSETARAPILARAFFALRTIDSGLGLMVLGLD